MRRLLFTLLLVVASILPLTSCVGADSEKTTGGGWFIDAMTGDKITFGFNAQPVGTASDDFQPAKGQFQLVDHEAKINVHGDFELTGLTLSPQAGVFAGTCTAKGVKNQKFGQFNFAVLFFDSDNNGPDNGDGINVELLDQANTIVYVWSGILSGGNIVLHAQ